MCRDTGCHTDRDTFRTVHQKVRDTHRKYDRFLLRLVKVRHEVYNILVQISQIRFLCDLRKSRLSITHCGCTVSFDRTEVTVSVYKDHSFFKFLCHDHQCVIDGTVSVRVIFTHGISDDTRTFTVRFVIPDPQFVHIVKCTSLYWFQSVSYIRQGSGNDYAHCIIDI